MRTTPERARIGTRAEFSSARAEFSSARAEFSSARAEFSSARAALGSRTSNSLTAYGLSALSALSLLFCALLSDCAAGKGTIGALIAEDEQTGRLFIREVPPGLAAARANLEPGDEILLIDGLDVRPMDPKQIHAALVGEVDSQVKLTLIRDEQVRRVTLKRTEAQRIVTHGARTGAPEEPPKSLE